MIVIERDLTPEQKEARKRRRQLRRERDKAAAEKPETEPTQAVAQAPEPEVKNKKFILTEAWALTNYKKYNRIYFSSSLPDEIGISLSKTASRWLGQATVRMTHSYRSGSVAANPDGWSLDRLAIKFAVRNTGFTEEDWTNVLLHEMIHVWQYCHQSYFEWNSNAHGASFEKWMAKINDDGHHVTKTGESKIYQEEDGEYYYFIWRSKRSPTPRTLLNIWNKDLSDAIPFYFGSAIIVGALYKSIGMKLAKPAQNTGRDIKKAFTRSYLPSETEVMKLKNECRKISVWNSETNRMETIGDTFSESFDGTNRKSKLNDYITIEEIDDDTVEFTID